MQAGGQDNYPYVKALMNAISPVNFDEGTEQVVFPAFPGQRHAYYYFSKPLSFSRNANVDCKTAGGLGDNGSTLVFPPGVDGVIQESPYFTGGGYGMGSIRGCRIMSLGAGVQISSGHYEVTSATINAGGSGYGSGTGTMTFSGAGYSTTNPVLNVTATGGVVTSINSITNPGVCAYIISGLPSWTAGGGLSAGTGFSANTVQHGTNNTNYFTQVQLNDDIDPAFMTFPASCNPEGRRCRVGVGDGVIAISSYLPIE